MNRKSARKASSQVAVLTLQVEQLAETKAQLLDLLNAIVLASGGLVEVPFSKLEGHQRRMVHVDVRPPDPERAGDSGAYRVTLEGYAPEERVREVADRLRLQGLWLPRRDGQA